MYVQQKRYYPKGQRTEDRETVRSRRKPRKSRSRYLATSLRASRPAKKCRGPATRHGQRVFGQEREDGLWFLLEVGKLSGRDGGFGGRRPREGRRAGWWQDDGIVVGPCWEVSGPGTRQGGKRGICCAAGVLPRAQGCLGRSSECFPLVVSGAVSSLSGRVRPGAQHRRITARRRKSPCRRANRSSGRRWRRRTGPRNQSR